MTSPLRTRPILTVLLCAALALRILFVTVSSPVDDAYITYRYADNLAAGHGFVYNPGERVLGTTTPLFTLLLVPFAVVGLPADTMALILAVLFDVGICVLLFMLFRRSHGDAAGLAAAGIYGLSYAAAAACGYGMETQLFMFLVVAAFTLLTRQRWTAAATVTALATMTRPEGFLLAGIVAMAMLFTPQGRKQFARAAAVFVALAGAWYAFAWIYFGSPIPNSAHAKLLQTGISQSQWIDFFVTRNPVVMLLWACAVVGAIAGMRKREPGAVLFTAWLVVYMLFFRAVRPPFLGGWYFPPLVLSLTVLTAFAASVIGTRILRTPGRALAVTLVLALALVVTVLPKSIASNRWNRTVAQTVFVPIAEWVRDHTTQDTIVHAADVGYLGYFSGRRIVDAAALVTPEVGRYYAQHRNQPDWDIAYVLEHRPGVVVLPVRGDIYRRFSASSFAHEYQPQARFQVEGENDLHPPLDIAERYTHDARFMADYIIYTRTR